MEQDYTYYQKTTYDGVLDFTRVHVRAWNCCYGIKVMRDRALNGGFIINDLLGNPMWAFDKLNNDKIYVFQEELTKEFFKEGEHDYPVDEVIVIEYKEYREKYLIKSRRPKPISNYGIKWGTAMK